jgi:adenylate cyclase
MNSYGGRILKFLINKFPFTREINMIEIERKFLVISNAYKDEAFKKTRIIQGFLNTHPERTVRVRLKENKGILAVKGETSKSGVTRFEWEKDISKTEAEALLKLCEKGIIDKIRYEVQVGNHIFEVDEFFEDNLGLVVAEIELKTEDETFVKPKWLGEEVTGQIKYYNSQLSKHPFNTWES